MASGYTRPKDVGILNDAVDNLTEGAQEEAFHAGGGKTTGESKGGGRGNK